MSVPLIILHLEGESFGQPGMLIEFGNGVFNPPGVLHCLTRAKATAKRKEKTTANFNMILDLNQYFQ
jgi:hypothetical protein